MIMRTGVLVLLVLAGCGTATGARQGQTQEAEGWACFSSPVVTCPNRPRQECSGWDERWIATCPDTGATFGCSLQGGDRGGFRGRRAHCAEMIRR